MADRAPDPRPQVGDALRRTCDWIAPNAGPSLAVVIAHESPHPRVIHQNAALTGNECDPPGWDCVFVRVDPRRQRELDVATRGGTGTRSFSAERDPDFDLMEVAGRSDEDFAAWVALAPDVRFIAVGERLFTMVDPREPMSVQRRVSDSAALDLYLRGAGGDDYASNIDQMVEQVASAFETNECERGLLTLNTLEAFGPDALRGQTLFPALQQRRLRADVRAVVVTLESRNYLRNGRYSMVVARVGPRLSVAWADGIEPIPVVHL